MVSLPLWFLSYAMNMSLVLRNTSEANDMYKRVQPHYDFAMDHPGASLHARAFIKPAPPLKITPAHNRRLLQNLHMVEIPETYDLRTGSQQEVFDQKHCNSCFAITAAEQINYWTKQHNFPPVSYHTLLECAPSAFGCQGGLMENVFEWGGPYYGDSCDGLTGLEVDDYVVISDLEGGDVEPHLAAAVYQYGPIPVGIDSTSSRFLTYRSGVIQPEECNKVPNHAVVVVGYTPAFWIVKNSWGDKWGEGGYAKISRGHDTCGISSYASFATHFKL
jgi:cathepsin L